MNINKLNNLRESLKPSTKIWTLNSDFLYNSR